MGNLNLFIPRVTSGARAYKPVVVVVGIDARVGLVLVVVGAVCVPYLGTARNHQTDKQGSDNTL